VSTSPNRLNEPISILPTITQEPINYSCIQIKEEPKQEYEMDREDLINETKRNQKRKEDLMQYNCSGLKRRKSSLEDNVKKVCAAIKKVQNMQ
jgi:hypothetical protein